MDTTVTRRLPRDSSQTQQGMAEPAVLTGSGPMISAIWSAQGWPLSALRMSMGCAPVVGERGGTKRKAGEQQCQQPGCVNLVSLCALRVSSGSSSLIPTRTARSCPDALSVNLPLSTCPTPHKSPWNTHKRPHLIAQLPRWPWTLLPPSARSHTTHTQTAREHLAENNR